MERNSINLEAYEVFVYEHFRGGRCPAHRQRRRVPAAPSSHPSAPWGVPDPSEMDIVTPEPSFVGGRRSVRVLGGGCRSALLLGGGRRLALLLGCGRHSALLLGCGRRSAPPLGGAVALDPLALPSGPLLPPLVSLLLLAPPTCLALILVPPTCLALVLASPHSPCFCFSLPPQCLALLLAPPTGLSMFLAPPQDPSLNRTFWGGLRWKRYRANYTARAPPPPRPHETHQHHAVSHLDWPCQRSMMALLIAAAANFFVHQTGVYCDEGTKGAFLLSLLMGRALDWASAVWDVDPQIRTSFTYFTGMIREVFEYPAGGKDISLQLMELRQGSDLAVDYAIKFRTLAGKSSWNDTALWAVFREGLSPALQSELACREDATSLSQYVATASCLDNLLRQYHAGARPPVSFRPRLHPDYPRPREEGELVRGWVYPLSLPEARAMEEYIEEALAVGHIRPSMSPAAAGFFFVGKKDGGLRLCIDYRGLNTITVRYPYPLPLGPVALERLRGARFFTKQDLRSAYNLVQIWEGDEWKTAFHTTHGHYEYLVMPFGLTNAPAVFQSLINKVFQDILGKWVIAYINDILVYSISLEEHVHHIRAVLSRLPQNHLYVKPEKFHRTTVTFLGYVILRQGVEMDLTKVHAVTEWPNPTTVKELQQFLGFANFIRNYSSMAGPLTSLFIHSFHSLSSAYPELGRRGSSLSRDAQTSLSLATSSSSSGGTPRRSQASRKT
ncbi:hypothetical protein QTP70_032115 [Hemibagrus guttatus]|uniref:ribonuclease H n=1 Tax=Hemibagrus guttatus TaxID=175788 RepID=A0AAE0UZZ9_9TELE|nr:hypothetical protein QTP70_032115 [Hemibagrus guttatus]